MRRVLKSILWVGGILAVLAGIGAAYLAATFDPDKYKGEVERLVQEQTGRTLKLSGKLGLTFYPSVGVRVAGVSLSEHFSEQEFLSFASAHASVKVLPLLRGEVIVDALRIDGLKARVVQGKNGRFNFDDLLGGAQEKPAAQPKMADAKKTEPKKAEPKAESKAAPVAKGTAGPVAFQVSSVRVERAAIDYRDLAAGSEMAISDLRLSTGRIAEAASGRLELSARAKGKNPDLDLVLELRSGYQLDLPKAISLQKLDARLTGAAAGLTGLQLAADGDAAFDLPANQLKVGALNFSFKGANGADALDGSVRLSGARLSERTLSVPKIAIDLSLASPDLPAVLRPLKLPLTGSIRANFAKQTASAELAGKIDESNLAAKIGLSRFSPPSYAFDIDIDRLNLDRYVAPEPVRTAATPPAAKAEPAATGAPASAAPAAPAKPGAVAETPVDLSPLRGLDGAGKLRIGALQVRGLHLSEVKAELRAVGGRVDISPHSASLYGGAVAGDLTLDANGNRIALKETLSEISMGPLLKDVAQKEYVTGKGSLSMDVSAAGASVEAMKRALAGTAKINLREGALQGFDALEILRKAQSIVGAQTAQGSGKSEKTDFGELKASFTIAEGVARNGDLDVIAPGLRIVGSGIIDVGHSRLDYRVIPRLVTNKEGRGVEAPTHLSGSFDDLQYEVNYGQVVRDVIRNTGRSLRDGVKRLLGQ